VLPKDWEQLELPANASILTAGRVDQLVAWWLSRLDGRQLADSEAANI